jgi:hypothetical protein
MNGPSSAAMSWRSYGNRWRRVSYTYNLAGALDLVRLAAPAEFGQTPQNPCLRKKFTWHRPIWCRAEGEGGLQGHERSTEVGQVSL